jgi:hypothetical protein
MGWRSQYCKDYCLPVSMRYAVRNFVRMLRESKVWEVQTEDIADGSSKAEPSSRAEPSAAASAAVQWHDEDGGNIAERLPERYRRWASVFSEEEINHLLDHTKNDHKIQLVDEAQPPFGPIYPWSEKELQALREYLRKELAAGKIRESKSPAGAPIIFLPKPDGSLRLCVDYRGLNRVTVKDRTPLPLMSELRERLARATIFTKLDLKNGYNLIRIAEGDEWKTAFRTTYGLFEYLVMPFGLCNVPGTSQAMINKVLHDLLDEGVIVYIDHKLLYSENEESHIRLVEQVLCASIKKSVFHASEVKYLGYCISKFGIAMSPEKVHTIKAWAPARSVKHV